jgi:hypothetical protein
MKIKESKNLKYDSYPLGHFEDAGDVDPAKCILDGFTVTDDKIELHFMNGRVAELKVKNADGDVELDMIAIKLNDFMGKNYVELLEAEF